MRRLMIGATLACLAASPALCSMSIDGDDESGGGSGSSTGVDTDDSGVADGTTSDSPSENTGAGSGDDTEVETDDDGVFTGDTDSD